MEKIIHTQKQFDSIKDDFKGHIIIRDTTEWLNINKAFNNAEIYIFYNATIESISNNVAIKSVSINTTIKSIYDNATIESVFSNATIGSIYGNATIKSVSNNATIGSIYGNATIKFVSDSAIIESVYGNATIESVYDNVMIKFIYGNATIKFISDNATIGSIYDNATIKLMTGLASITLLYSAKKIVARGTNLIRQIGTKKINIKKSPSVNFIQIKEDISKKPSFSTYKKLYPVESTKTKAIMYKAVHKVGKKYLSDYDNNIKYKIGETLSLMCSKNQKEGCGEGIHLSHLRWAYLFGKNWKNLAILECETDIKDVVVSKDCNGKVRTSKCKILREIPKEEYI